jgi:hypothetical protein
MRYLKSYKIFESHTDDIIENVKDILLPINDMGYNVSVNHYIINGDTNQLIIRVVTYVDKPLLITDEIKEEFIRMKDYLHSEGYTIKAIFYLEDRKEYGFVPFDEFINTKEPIANLLFNVENLL